jgi:hypothetical protein
MYLHSICGSTGMYGHVNKLFILFCWPPLFSNVNTIHTVYIFFPSLLEGLKEKIFARKKLKVKNCCKTRNQRLRLP